MLVSMTGFGVGRVVDQQINVVVEVRTVNHRYFEPYIRLPRGYMALEEKIRAEVAKVIRRGRVEISVLIEDFTLRGRTVTLDSRLLRSYHVAVNEAKELVPVEGELTVAALVAVPELFQIRESPVDPESVWPWVGKALGQALEAVVQMRRAEGARLQEDILGRLSVFAQCVEDIATRAPAVVEAYRARLVQRLAEWHRDVTVDENRLSAEVALMAERSNIDEEIVRLRSHIAAFESTCAADDPVGRKLDFLLQEMNREINTIGSKASDGEIAGYVVDAKAELEKMREQVQNIE